MRVTGIVAEKGFGIFSGERRIHAGHPVPRVWVVVANREHVHVYRKAPDGLEEIADAQPGMESIPTEAQKTSGHISAAPGSVFYTSNPLDRENHHDDKMFMKSVAAWLEKAGRADTFDRLIIAAAPIALGDIRKAISPAVRKTVVAELNKDLTNLPTSQLDQHFDGIIAA